MTIAERLIELGITLPAAADPVGVYRAAVRTGNLVYLAGQVNVRDGKFTARGKLGAEIDVATGHAAARQCAINCLAAAAGVLDSLDAIEQVVRLSGFVASAPGFTQQPQVVNGASELLRDVLGETIGIGTRLAVGVAELPAGAPVEVDLILQVRD
jgi:enamine deaminase RidA (YjgF/YER057c/UK114 family)